MVWQVMKMVRYNAKNSRLRPFAAYRPVLYLSLDRTKPYTTTTYIMVSTYIGLFI
jgi:hypothetical protein